ncbi:hypothetical protein EYF80_016608 [Liparis tanakae]|uniref:Uncharacterized protein n=1 Tax=Liparis tanakae TaxID=230148 RepID=A0A4Z2I764_9TELE|nr:hypothetical protein EYF80_016608 [Liparis tanakae]
MKQTSGVDERRGQLLDLQHGVRLVLGSPLEHLAVGLGELNLQLGFGLLLLLQLLPEHTAVVVGRLQRLPLHIFGGLADAGFGTLELANRSVTLLQAAAVLGCKNGPEEGFKVGGLTLFLLSCSTLAARSSASSLNSNFSFSSFCLALCRASICSLSSVTMSECFLLSAAAVASW